ncbi:HEAT repeat domain-containing protein [Aeoliella sp.]|uniref:HEAT repeat domain-containing protein n=1 Tax=Aeoliella sp. TaxID=2795800 RepID=UPI003CCB804E
MNKPTRLYQLMFGCLLSAALASAAVAEDELLEWHADYDEATKQALADQKLILVRAGAPWCAWCKLLDAEIAKPEVQEELAKVTLLEIDIDDEPELATKLNINAVPALRVITPHGRLIASQDGFLEAEPLKKWLQDAQKSTDVSVDAALMSEGEPTVLEVVRVVRQFDARDASLREAAIQRLMPYPKASAGAVIKTLREGGLSSRLAAYELMSEWQAPLGEIDPWTPETLTEERFDEVTEWMTTIDARLTPGVARKLSDEELDGVRGDIERMITATPDEVIAIRERIARLGGGVLPEVLERIKTAQTDQARERLVALRYRLAAPGRLELDWPGGLERLADSDASVRHAAAEEVAEMGRADNEALLLELFSDADPLVREISLRGLRKLEGERATEALASLLSDPEPNVRAAVLKQLAEDGSSTMLQKVMDYVEEEQDPNLLVHAIRYFRETGDKQARPTLIKLLKHDSWQVRAEAAEAIGKTIENHYFSSNGPQDDETSKVRAALLETIKDPDAFVVSKVLESLEDVNQKAAVEPLVAAAMKHPALASQIVQLLANGSEMREASVPHLQKFFKHEDPVVRAAAIRGLCQTATEGIEDEMIAAMSDPASEVRLAAATSLMGLLDTDRPATATTSMFSGEAELDDLFGPGVHIVPAEPAPPRGFFSNLIGAFFESSPAPAPEPNDEADQLFGDEAPADAAPAEAENAAQPQAQPPEEQAALPWEESEEEDQADNDAAANSDQQAERKSDDAEETEEEQPEPPDPLDEWLRGLYAGDNRPEWTEQLREPLQKMLQSDDAEQRTAAALALVPLGNSVEALPQLLADAADDTKRLREASRVLRWLVWEDRADTFLKLYDLTDDDGVRSTIFYQLSNMEDARATDLYWQVLSRDDSSSDVAETAQRAIMQAYLGERYWDTDSLTSEQREQLAEKITPHVNEGTALKRLTAINMLMQFAADAAAEGAQRLLEDETAADALRSDAFQITLLTGSRTKSNKAAIAALTGEDEHRRRVALRFLALGAEAMTQLPATGLHVQRTSTTYYSSSGQPIVPAPPFRLESKHVRPLLESDDPEIKAYAGYLLTTFEDAAGLEPLLEYRAVSEQSDELDKLAYRAIAVLNDSEHTQVLRDIYKGLDDHQVSDFYWTVRIMSVPGVLQLRKEIRDERGMDQLQ